VERPSIDSEHQLWLSRVGYTPIQREFHGRRGLSQTGYENDPSKVDRVDVAAFCRNGWFDMSNWRNEEISDYESHRQHFPTSCILLYVWNIISLSLRYASFFGEYADAGMLERGSMPLSWSHCWIITSYKTRSERSRRRSDLLEPGRFSPTEQNSYFLPVVSPVLRQNWSLRSGRINWIIRSRSVFRKRAVWILRLEWGGWRYDDFRSGEVFDIGSVLFGIGFRWRCHGGVRPWQHPPRVRHSRTAVPPYRIRLVDCRRLGCPPRRLSGGNGNSIPPTRSPRSGQLPVQSTCLQRSKLLRCTGEPKTAHTYT